MASKANTTSLLEAIKNKLNKFDNKNANSTDKVNNNNISANPANKDSQTPTSTNISKENITESNIDNKKNLKTKAEDNPDIDIDDETNQLKNAANKILKKQNAAAAIIDFEDFEIDFEAENGVNNYFSSDTEVDIEALKKEIGYVEHDDEKINSPNNNLSNNADKKTTILEENKTNKDQVAKPEQPSPKAAEDPKNIDPIELEILKLEQEIAAKKQKTEAAKVDNAAHQELKSILDKEFAATQEEINREINKIAANNSPNKINSEIKKEVLVDQNVKPNIDSFDEIANNLRLSNSTNFSDNISKALDENRIVNNPKDNEKITQNNILDAQKTELNNQIHHNDSVEDNMIKNHDNSSINSINIEMNNQITNNINSDNAQKFNETNSADDLIAQNNNKDDIDDLEAEESEDDLEDDQKDISDLSFNNYNFLNFGNKKFSPALDFLNSQTNQSNNQGLEKIADQEESEDKDNEEVLVDDNNYNDDLSINNLDKDVLTNNNDEDFNQNTAIKFQDNLAINNNFNLPKSKFVADKNIDNSLTNNEINNDEFIGEIPNRQTLSSESQSINDDYQRFVDFKINNQFKENNMTNDDKQKSQLVNHTDNENSNVKSLKTNKLDYNIIHEEVAYQAQNSIKKLMEAKNLVGSVNSFVHDQVLTKVAVSLLEPKLEKWLNDNLPNLVEEIVRQEIEKIMPKDTDEHN